MKKLILLNLFALFLYTNASCITPNNEPGECISVLSCPPLVKILRNKPVSPQNSQYLQSSQCGFDGDTPKVCCRTTTRVITKTLITQEEAFINGIKSDLLPTKKQCGASTDDKMYGATKAEIGEYPWMALLEYQKSDGTKGFYCGGALISKRYVLTAAHCVKGDLPKTWKLRSVRLGEHDISTEKDCIKQEYTNIIECSDPPQNIEIEERIPHKSYNPLDYNMYNDIALLRLSRDVHFTQFISPICIPTTPSELKNDFLGKNLTVAGWGKTETKIRSNIMLKLKVPVRTNSECSSVYRTVQISVGKGQICAGGLDGQDSCGGDSGGPLMHLSTSADNDNIWTAAGIVSFGSNPCGLENWPGVYTKVGQYAAWIVNNMKP